MQTGFFEQFFSSRALQFLVKSIDLALEEDGEDLTSRGLFRESDKLQALIVAKENCILAGLPLIELILSRTGTETSRYRVSNFGREGAKVQANTRIAAIEGSALAILKSERVILNYLSHLSGIATLTNSFVQELSDSVSKITDTRKTLPGLRYPEKYAVLVGGGQNHRLDLQEMIMLKDNHIDRAGGISLAVNKIRENCQPCPPIEVECRNEADVEEAIACGVDRIMLDNMEKSEIGPVLAKIPREIETEISGGVSQDNIREIGKLGADYISCGFLTHSAGSVDLSMQLFNGETH
uniref:nicotinate-nucleotide diphosphorylase (carboxylating) n=1 Tax=uncultured organism TaxID=155900 RepID=M1PWZ2_9ZZZZ|nr:nicotinate-nucleotide diphosphorylase (carboxylating) [uncultured organism]